MYYLKVDGLQWAINQVKASTLWYGILVGFADAETPEEIIRPVTIVMPPVLLIGESTAQALNPTLESVLIGESSSEAQFIVELASITLSSAYPSWQPILLIGTSSSSAEPSNGFA